MTDRRIEYLPLDEIVPAERNPKDHDRDGIAASLRRFGTIEIITRDDRTGRLISGHGRTEQYRAARDAGEDPPDGVQVDDAGVWLVPVVCGWASADDDEARAALIAVNRLVQRGGWKLDELGAMLDDLRTNDRLDLAVGYDDDELDTLLAGLESDLPIIDEPAPSHPYVEPEVDTPERRVNRGDTWILGNHRLRCGDSFQADDVDSLLAGDMAGLVLTDPPFAVYGSSTGVSSSVADDKMVAPFFERLFAMIEPRVPKFAHVYVHCDWRSWATIWRGAISSGLSPKNCLVWDKGGSGLGSNWANTYELIGYFAKIPDQSTMSNRETGQRVVHRSNMLRFNRPRGDDRMHNAAKPVAMLAEIIDAASDPEDVVLDLFGGSGSTLIACEQTGRRCRMMEMEPKACDVIVARWEAVTGKTAEKSILPT